MAPPTLLARTVREVFRRERIPTRLLWWFAAEGMAEWMDLLRRDLAPHLGGTAAAEALLAEAAVPLFQRRHDVLHARFRGVPRRADDAAGRRETALLLGGLWRIARKPEVRWAFLPLGGAPATFAEHLRAEALMDDLSLHDRWVEVTHHLGELLVALTDHLPARLPRARPILGDLCFAAGERFGRKMRHAFAMDESPAHALELLRMSEYVFRVNPDHWGGADRDTGWLEGTACPWYSSPGWNGAHCGIFGQFQSGISAAFGLRYHLTTTIPKAGGHTCRIDVRPRAPLPAAALRRERRAS